MMKLNSRKNEEHKTELKNAESRELAYSEDLSLELMDAQEAADLLKIEKGTVYKWKYEKKLPYVKLHGRLLFNKLDLINFVADRTALQGF